MKNRTSKFSDRGPGPTQRQLRVGEEIRHVLSAILLRREFADAETIPVPVTITEVRVGGDLKSAVVFFTPLVGQDDANRADVQALPDTLNNLAPALRHELSRKIALKFMPRLKFRLDTSLEEAGRIEALLRNPRVAADLSGEDEADT